MSRRDWLQRVVRCGALGGVLVLGGCSAASSYRPVAPLTPSSDVGREQPPPPLPEPLSPAAGVESVQLPNGMRVLMVARDTLPIAVVRYVALGAGNEDASAEQVALPELTARALVSGGTRFSDEELRDIAISGVRIDPLVGDSMAILQFQIGSEAVDRAIELLARTVRYPTFSEIGSAKAELERQLLSDWDAHIADQLLNEQLFGRDDRRAVQPRKWLQQLHAIDVSDLRRWHARYRPEASRLIVVGHFDRERVLRQAKAAFGDWTATQPAPARVEPTPAEPSTGAKVLLSGSKVTRLTVAVRTVPLDHPDHLGLDLLARALGRTMTSSAWIALRQQTGLAYHVATYHHGTWRDGLFVVTTYVKPEALARTLSLLGEELDALGTRRLTEADLAAAKRARGEQLDLRDETNAGVADQLTFVPTLGDPAEDLPKLRAQLASFTLDQLHELVRRYLNDDRRLILIVGGHPPGDAGLRGLHKPAFFTL